MKLIKKWRNEQIEILRQNIPLTDNDQQNYYSKIIKPAIIAEKPKIIIFSFMNKGKCIGYGGLTNIDWFSKRAELSFLAETKRSKNLKLYKRDFYVFLNLIMNVSFNELGLNRVYTETFDIRPFHIKILEKFGFKLEGRMKKHAFVNNSFFDSLIHGYLVDQHVRK